MCCLLWGYGWSLVSPVLQQTKHVVEMLFCQPTLRADVQGHELQEQMQGVALGELASGPSKTLAKKNETTIVRRFLVNKILLT